MKKFLVLVFLIATLMAEAQPVKTDPFRQKALVLKRFLEKNHYQPVSWNDTSSAMLYNKWLEQLDEEKLFFTKNDISILETYRTKLDAEMNGGDWKFFESSFNIYRQRLQKTDSILQKLFAKPFDFSKPDQITWPCLDYAANDAELAQRWSKYLKWQVLNSIADDFIESEKSLGTSLPPDFAKLEAATRQEVKEKEERYIKNLLRTPATLLADMQEAYLNSISWCYDPHTTYMNMAEKDDFETAMSASEYSAGFELEENEKGEPVIAFLQPGGSAWKNGKLHKGDVLVKVKSNGVEKNAAAVSPEELDDLLSGNSRTDVEVTVRTTAGEIRTIKLVKEKITDEESIVKSYVLHGTKNIGYINLPGFYSREAEGMDSEKEIKYDGCANDVSKEIVKLKKDTIAGLILDLRYNGGGSMWEAMQLSGIFIDIGPVASVKEKGGKVHFLKDPNRGTIYDGPLLVLVNGASASASEFVSAVLQDYNRAIIVGGTTYGKGTAQIVLPMDTGIANASKNYEDFVKVTESKFYRVNGSTAQWKGVVPDIVLPDVYSDDRFKERANESALQPDLGKTGIYQPLTAPPLAALNSSSRQRIAADDYFKAVDNFSAWLTQYYKGRNIPLQWADYIAHYKKTAEMFKMLGEDEEGSITSTLVRNNSFDQQRINVSATDSKEINEVYLQQVKSDKTIEEAYRILMDWTGKK
ncbi:MAG: carboxy terminal-processing peptidase [Gloeobacteraceae cyanobacterium ES-bin-316]|nr:carboxy terminal-processing peptidase [Ferruginibacter sp.]